MFSTIPFGAFIELTKPRILNLVLITATLGFFLGGRGIERPLLLVFTLVGTGLVVAGAAALNHYLERDVDRLMQRTRRRPLPAGTIRPATAMSYGLVLVMVGLGILLLKVNLLTAFLALLSAFLYVVIYTPMKRMTWLNTSLGAVPGALPPVGGWTAATGELDWGAWALFAILFAWQHPHFYAIAWMFRDDYRRGGFKMLPDIDQGGDRTCRHIIGFSLLLIVVSALPTVLGLTGLVYLLGALVMGVGMLVAGFWLAATRTIQDARKLLKASVIYLPLLLLLSVVDVSF